MIAYRVPRSLAGLETRRHPPVDNLSAPSLCPNDPAIDQGHVVEQWLLFGASSLGEVLVRTLLAKAGGTVAAVERWGSSAIERKLVALERQRAKLVPMLAMHRMSGARRARLRRQLANVDEMIRLVKRIPLH